MQILLTGANGFIGRRLVQYFIRLGLQVSCIGRSHVNIAGAEDIIVAELAPAAIEKALTGRTFEVIVHLAAAGVNPQDRDQAALLNINAFLPQFLVTLAVKLGAKAMLMAGSSAEYSGPLAIETLTELTPLETAKLYGATKAAGSILALAQGAASGLPVSVIRLFNVYGPGEAPHRLLPCLMNSLAAQKPVSLSMGTQIRDFVYIEDVCAGLWQALGALLERRMLSGAYNLATGLGTSVADFARQVARAMGAAEELLNFGKLPLRADDLPFLVGDPSALKQACGWSPAWNLEAGIKATISEQLPLSIGS